MEARISVLKKWIRETPLKKMSKEAKKHYNEDQWELRLLDEKKFLYFTIESPPDAILESRSIVKEIDRRRCPSETLHLKEYSKMYQTIILLLMYYVAYSDEQLKEVFD